MLGLLNELDRYGMKATFFLPGMRVAEEPELAKEITARGHEVENNTLNRSDIESMSYADTFKELDLSEQIIADTTGVKPKFFRTATDHGDGNADVLLAAAQSGLKAAVSHNLLLSDEHLDKELQDPHFLRHYLKRGAIVSIDIETNKRTAELLSHLAAAAKDVNYSFVTLNTLLQGSLAKKSLDPIQGFDAAAPNPDYANQQYRFIGQSSEAGKEIAITLDDWGTDYTVTRILDIFAEHGIKATFFLRADGVERNPNLARAIVEEGHEVGNHSYSHPKITTIPPDQLQDEVVRAHRIITEAIQQQPTMLFRPPAGNVDDASAKVVAATGYKDIALFDVDPKDWNKSNNAEQIVNSVMEQVDAGGRVILLHLLDDTHTIEALPDIIEGLQAKGYRFVKLSEMPD